MNNFSGAEIVITGLVSRKPVIWTPESSLIPMENTAGLLMIRH
jgi:hypothetical protein